MTISKDMTIGELIRTDENIVPILIWASLIYLEVWMQSTIPLTCWG